MPSALKKYKLYASANDESGEKPACAFFASETGCRNGDTCKFSHSFQSSPSLDFTTNKNKTREMVVSSESSESEMESPFVSKAVSKTLHVPSKSNEDTIAVVDNGKLENSYSSLAQAQPAPDRKRKNSQMIAKPKTKKKSLNSQNGISLQVKEEIAAQEETTKSSLSFRFLNLPVSPPIQRPIHSDVTTKVKDSRKQATPTNVDDSESSLPLPKSTIAGKEWRDLVKKTQSHQRFNGNYNFLKYMEQDELIGYASNTWVKTVPFPMSKADHPQVIAIDCEMCEAQDPLSGKKDTRALCRVSVIDVATDEILLDTLVKPMWPVSDYRDWINGITEESLEKVQFTLRHAQAFVMELCSEETVIIGHAIHNDLAALRVEHYCCVDSALLYKAVDSERATVALRDLAKSILGEEMPKTHDSVNDARVAIACVKHFRKHDGEVEAVVRTPKPQIEGQEHSDRPVHKQLFIHRIPSKNCNEKHLETMFLEHTHIQPELVDKIEFNAKGLGRTHVHFTSGDHAKLAFHSLHGKAEIENSGRLQKNIYLRDGNYIRVRMMTSENKQNQN